MSLTPHSLQVEFVLLPPCGTAKTPPPPFFWRVASQDRGVRCLESTMQVQLPIELVVEATSPSFSCFTPRGWRRGLVLGDAPTRIMASGCFMISVRTKAIVERLGTFSQSTTYL